MAELDIYPLAATIAPLATLAGCVIGGIANLRRATQRIRERFTIVFVLTLSLLLLPVEIGSLSYYVLSAFHPGTEIGGPVGDVRNAAVVYSVSSHCVPVRRISLFLDLGATTSQNSVEIFCED